ncbi:SMI1/KNR4 family protein [Paenibacillus sacheonensis]|uniref:SMI1/KNR4 family protein n=1 Tax=Paenibacillus sacheonensis TaxID=742054 RepID=A0A7X5BZZ9_9BACL|nr:SMI1/KNR4 family protein [Paenibacillus sacheonensis]MBM7565956.1 hypothetical protein [Paenibacillus sacheonensis]NBC68730.1 SMI1/KNR4 family protein [Paenibacillus sacheonensis]
MDRESIMALLYEYKLQDYGAPFKGCSMEEIASLERGFARPLPLTYRAYLSAAGHESGKLFRGTDASFSVLEELQPEARELLRENGDLFTLPETAFVFAMHQGWVIYYFELDKGDDPPVLCWSEGSGAAAETISPSYSAYLMDEIKRHAR